MRIVIDLQSTQGANRHRGIGRYALALALAIAKFRGEHEILIAANGDFPGSVDWLRSQFKNVLPPSNIRAWYGIQPTAATDVMNDWRQRYSAVIRETFLSELRPDLVVLTSLFEGLVDGVVTSIGDTRCSFPTAVILYDLIPYNDQGTYLKDPTTKRWYMSKIEALKKASMWWSISEHSRQQGIDLLGLKPDLTTNISIDADPQFTKRTTTTEALHELVATYGIDKPFIMYTGGIDPRKNIDRLVRGYAKLPPLLRAKHQLVIVCSVEAHTKANLEMYARKQGLGEGELILTGFVSDDVLVQMYNACRLFVFPSVNEGFGLPVLEAMRCGAPVIGAKGSSLSELIGEPAAMFDPYDGASIAKVIQDALTDKDLRALLIKNGDEKSRRYRWETSARRALQAAEEFHKSRRASFKRISINSPLKLAYVSPLPPEQSGISAYSAELIPHLSKYYQIDAVSASSAKNNAPLVPGCNVVNAKWFSSNFHTYDRILYHFGNSSFHAHMFPLLEKAPGVVALHDFFLSGIVAHMDRIGLEPGFFGRELVYSHGYRALGEHLTSTDSDKAVWKYPCNLRVLENAVGVICHSKASQALADEFYGSLLNTFEYIPHLREPTDGESKSEARKRLGISNNTFLVCSLGMLGPQKKSLELLQAWQQSTFSKNKDYKLVFVGQESAGDYSAQMRKLIDYGNTAGNITITGYVGADTYKHYLSSADMCVQLRTKSRGETSGAVLDCLNVGVPTIINANGSMAELPDHAVVKLGDNASVHEIAEALENLAKDRDRRQSIARSGQEMVRQQHNPSRCAEMYYQAIERLYKHPNAHWMSPLGAISRLPCRPSKDSLIKASIAIAETFPTRKKLRQLCVDVSELIQRDLHTGIQRVVKKMLHYWLLNPPAYFRVEPVYATPGQPYRYARNFTVDLMGCKQQQFEDEVLETDKGDIFVALDLQPHTQIAHRAFYEKLRSKGVHTSFLVYDLLCVKLPQYFVSGADKSFHEWLHVVAEADSAICISEASKNDMRDWVAVNRPDRLDSLALEHISLGSDFLSFLQSGSADGHSMLPDGMTSERRIFAMVGTLEPRKGHVQVLDAFEVLWERGLDVCLCIVGKEGWMMKDFIQRLSKHREKGSRLFWISNANDAQLKHVYGVSSALIAASYGEGFGLPLVEAAAANTPIIARDIPVFKEVMGSGAFYFTATSAETLAGEISAWINLFDRNMHPQPQVLPLRSWDQTAAELFDKMCRH